MARRKQHLKYQAKKGRISKVVEDTTNNQAADSGGAVDVIEDQLVRTSEKANGKTPIEKTKEFTKLPESETKFIRKEIIYILLVVAFLGLIYIVIYLIFRNTGLDEWLSGFISLNK